VGENADVGQMAFCVIASAALVLAIASTEHAFIHPRATVVEMMRTGRPFSVPVQSKGSVFADNGNHGTTEEIENPSRRARRAVCQWVQRPVTTGVLERGVLLVGLEIGRIGDAPLEMKHIHAGQVASISSNVQVSTSEWMRSREPMGK